MAGEDACCDFKKTRKKRQKTKAIVILSPSLSPQHTQKNICYHLGSV